MISYTFVVPISIVEYVRKKDGKVRTFHLNLNNYTQVATCTHRRNKLKQMYSQVVKDTLPITHDMKGIPICIEYTLYPPDKRRRDLSNVCSIVDKYVSDALVDAGFIDDDDMKTIRQVVYKAGEVDKERPRCRVSICAL